MDNIQKLNHIIPVYFDNKTKMDSYKKSVDADNKAIKEIMKEEALPEFVVDGIKASYSVSTREEFIEEALIEKIKLLKKSKGVIKKKEYVDMDALENAIYNGKINAIDLASCQTKKEVVTLRIGKAKKNEEE